MGMDNSHENDKAVRSSAFISRQWIMFSCSFCIYNIRLVFIWTQIYKHIHTAIIMWPMLYMKDDNIKYIQKQQLEIQFSIIILTFHAYIHSLHID